MLKSEFLSGSGGVRIGPFVPTFVASAKVGNKSLPLPQWPFCLCQASEISYLSLSTDQASPSHACLLRGSLLDYNFCVLSAFSCSGFSLLWSVPAALDITTLTTINTFLLAGSRLPLAAFQ